MKKHYIAYEGRKLVIEWYYNANGHSQALDYAESLDEAEKKKLAALLMAITDIGQLRNEQKFRYEGNKIYALKPKPHRFLCFFYSGGRMIIANAFIKKQDKLPPNEKNRALRHMRDYEQRMKAGTYYDKD